MSGLNLEVALPYGDYKGQAKGDVPDGDGFLQVKPDASVIKMPIGPPEEVFGGTYDGTFSVGKFSGQGVYMFPETSTLRSYKVRVEEVAVVVAAARVCGHAWTARRDGVLWSGADLGGLPLPALCSSRSALRPPFALARQSALNCFGSLQGTFEAGKMHGPGVLEWRDGGTLSMNFHDGRARTTGEAPATLT